MKRVLLASAAFVAAAIMPATADGGMSAGDAWYVGFGAGANLLGDTDLETAVGSTLHAEFDTGWALEASVGYRWAGGLRAELEGAYRKNKIESIIDLPSAAVPSDDGDVTQFSLMANLLYDLRLSDNFSLNIGGGVGAASASVDMTGFGVQLVEDSGSNWSFAWQLIGGLSYSMSPNTEFFAEYHYVQSDDHDVVTFPNGFPLNESMALDNQTVTLGVRFALGR